MTDSDQGQQFEAPLALLQDIVDNLRAEPSADELAEQLATLEGAVEELLDLVAASLGELKWGNPSAQNELEDISEQLQDQLGVLGDALLSARSFEDLLAAQEEANAIQLSMPMTLSRLESLLDSLSEPPTPGLSTAPQAAPPAPQAPAGPFAEYARVEESVELLELLAVAVVAVDSHLADGDLTHFHQALQQVDQAALVLRAALDPSGRG